MHTMVRAYHEAMLAHRYAAGGMCDGILVALSIFEVKRGAGVEEVFGCNTCEYKSAKKWLYTEIKQNKPGRNPSELNVGLQLGLHNTSISTVGARRLLSSMSLPCPASSAMQKSANRFGPKMEMVNESDMAVKRKVVMDTVEMRGLPKDSPIYAEYDRQYNNPLRNARKQTPFAPASQSRDVVVENATLDKFVIAYHQTNKLCSLGHAKRQKGEKIQCPGHEGCSANVDKYFNIENEAAGGMICATKLLNGSCPIKVSQLTTDADGKGCHGFNSIMKAATGSETENLLDEQHLNRSLCRALTNAHLSRGMFPTAKTVAQKNFIQKRFAEDLSNRIQAELNACQKQQRKGQQGYGKVCARNSEMLLWEPL